MRSPDDGTQQRVAIILHSGAYDRIAYAISMATVYLAMGCQVQVLVTFGALRRFVAGHLQAIDEETPVALRERFERGLATGGIQPLAQTLADAKKMGLKLYACSNAMASLNIARNELSPDVDGVMGLAAFTGFALEATNTWYI